MLFVEVTWPPEFAHHCNIIHILTDSMMHVPLITLNIKE